MICVTALGRLWPADDASPPAGPLAAWSEAGARTSEGCLGFRGRLPQCRRGVSHVRWSFSRESVWDRSGDGLHLRRALGGDGSRSHWAAIGAKERWGGRMDRAGPWTAVPIQPTCARWSRLWKAEVGTVRHDARESLVAIGKQTVTSFRDDWGWCVVLQR